MSATQDIIKRGRGRPRNPDKQASLIVAAHRLLLANGAAGVTVDQLAAEAKVAKTTLYLYFKDKDAIIEAAVREESRRLLADDWLAQHAGMSFEETLADIGRQLITNQVTAEGLGFRRLVAELADRHPHLRDRMFDAAARRIHRILSAVLTRAYDEGHIDAPDISDATDALIGLWGGFFIFEAEAGLREVSADEVERHAHRGVRLFMRLFGKSQPA
ncbi:TetR/AcrR family transcriptional regulator [Sphingomonas sp. Root710]|uniref:TetR/AcrR family transcriptional regulator n=1 Tax=Sphingomonas sp. Root710 TaxID=1736594 RepID=UPI00138F8AB5|nr:TetR/AcrR family transcriptional regulator [Sphingomonas sp. Root710]